MKPKHSQAPQASISTFVIRIWHEWSLEGSQWRGRIKHLQSGPSAGFQDSDRMLEFFHSFGAFSEAEQPHEEKNRVRF